MDLNMFSFDNKWPAWKMVQRDQFAWSIAFDDLIPNHRVAVECSKSILWWCDRFGSLGMGVLDFRREILSKWFGVVSEVAETVETNEQMIVKLMLLKSAFSQWANQWDSIFWRLHPVWTTWNFKHLYAFKYSSPFCLASFGPDLTQSVGVFSGQKMSPVEPMDFAGCFFGQQDMARYGCFQK